MLTLTTNLRPDEKQQAKPDAAKGCRNRAGKRLAIDKYAQQQRYGRRYILQESNKLQRQLACARRKEQQRRCRNHACACQQQQRLRIANLIHIAALRAQII